MIQRQKYRLRKRKVEKFEDKEDKTVETILEMLEIIIEDEGEGEEMIIDN